MKRIALLIAAVLMLSGCVPHTELDKLGIAEAVGVDYDGREYTVTVQYFNTDASGGVTAVDSSAPNVTTVSGSGETIETALEAVSYASGSSIMLGSASVIVFGSGVSYPLIEPMRLALSHYSGNLHAYAAASDCPAAEIMNVKFSQGSSSVEKLKELLKNADSIGLTRPMSVCEALERLYEPTGSVILPLLTVSEISGELSDDGKGAVIAGGALYTGGVYAGKLTDAQMSCVHLLDPSADSPRRCELTLTLHGHDTRMMLYGITPRVEPGMKDGRLTLDITVNAEAKIVSTALPDPYRSRGELEALAAQEIRRRVSDALAQTVTKHGADPFGIEYAVRSRSPRLWSDISGDYAGYLSSADVTVTADVRMERYGVLG